MPEFLGLAVLLSLVVNVFRNCVVGAVADFTTSCIQITESNKPWIGMSGAPNHATTIPSLLCLKYIRQV